MEIAHARQSVGIAKRELDALLRHKRLLVLRAPGPGRVLRLVRNSGSSVKRGETIALFEHDVARRIEVYLKQEEAAQIGLGGEAVVYFPSLDKRVKARVETIDRTHGFVDEINKQYTWRRQENRSAKAVLVISGLSSEQIRKRFPPGLPAVVVFGRKSTSEMISGVARAAGVQ